MRSLHLMLLSAVFFIAACSSDDTVDVGFDTEESFTLTTANWMQALQLEYPEQEIRLRDLSLPRSHDAGMYIIQNCTVGANACNVQTQHQDMRAQLLDGIRSFDIRPLYKNGTFFTRHSRGCDGPGCYGVRVDRMLEQLRDFLEEHAELVLLDFSFWCYTNGDDHLFRNLITETLGDYLYRDFSDATVSFIDRPLDEIIPADHSSGKAVIMLHGIPDMAENRAAGFFTEHYIREAGSYANAQSFEEMAEDQLAKFQNFNPNGNSVFELSWTLTQDTEQALSCVFPGNQQSIESLAQSANQQLQSSMSDWIGSNVIRPGKIPNIIGVDFCESFVTEECIRLSRINLD